jgi:hypothetical protein
MSNRIRYTIKKGKHTSRGRFIKPLLCFSKIAYKVRFDSSAVYTTSSPQNRDDINKVIGFTDGFCVHKSSARIGWTYLRGRIHLFAYVYRDGMRVTAFLGEHVIGAEISISIEVRDTYYRFVANSISCWEIQSIVKSREKHGTNKVPVGFMLFPYFGGDETAPHDVRIYLTKQKTER